MSFNDHYSVFKKEAIDYLNIKEDGIYIDCTFGRGGHSIEILKRLSKKGRLIAIDCDLDSIEYFKKEFKNFDNCLIIHENFSNIDKILDELNIDKIDGVLYDFGVSSPQLDNPERGFSYHHDSLLDMRMDRSQNKTASDLLMTLSKQELINVFRKYGEINYSGKVVDEIMNFRKNNKEITTYEFVDIIKNSIPKKILYNTTKHPARKFFQALRIELNNELENIKISLEKVLNYLNNNARIVTITFHSLEDKIVKNLFNELTISKIPKEIPINEIKEYNIIKTNYVPTINEVKENNRSRSARIRVLEKN